MKEIVLFLLLSSVHRLSSLKTISDEDFARFPPLHAYDPFTECLSQPGGVYCTAYGDLLPGGNGPLYHTMRNYTESAIRHFNYTRIIRGYCMTKRCKEFHRGPEKEVEAVGACMNHSLSFEYGLHAKVTSTHCYRHEKTETFDIYDAIASTIFVLLILLAILATFYDCFVPHKDSKGYLMCFSLRANWARVTAPWPEDPMTARMIGLNGIRTITSILMVLLHSNLPQIILLENPHYIENAMETPVGQLMAHMHINMQTFFLLSGLLLAYTYQVSAEKNHPTWRSLPRNIFLRWFRLSPVYLIMLMFSGTLSRFAAYGPAWKETLGNEVADCRRYWPIMLFNLNNYVDFNECGLQHWSTSCDLHLHIIGLTVLTLSPSAKARNVALWLLFIIGFFLPGFIAYYRDLDGTLLTIGEGVHTAKSFNDIPTYKYLYKRTHANIPNFVIGIALGLLIYNILKKPIDNTKYKKFGYVYWLLYPFLLWLVYVNYFAASVEGERLGLPARLMYAMLQKPAWGLAMALLILGLVLQVEKVPVYRGFLEWRGWVPLMRLTYCLYCVHVPVLRFLGASSRLQPLSYLHVLYVFIGILGLSLPLALAVWLLVEAPFNNLSRVLFPEKKSVLERGEKKNE